MRLAAAALAAAAILAAPPAVADDRYEGYYYPPVESEERFERETAATPPANRAVRIGFVTAVTNSQAEGPNPPRYAIFAKGGEAEHLIMVALDDEIFRTIHRARGVLAQITAGLRRTEFFARQDLQVSGTFFDMLRILEFETLVISDGATWSHRIRFGPAEN